MKWGPKHVAVHKAWLDLHPEFEPTAVYKKLCQLLKLKEEAVERGLGKLFSEGKLKTKEKKPKTRKHGRREATAVDDFR